jgi:glycerol kinase
MQAQADLAQLPVDVYPSTHATALGAAALARLAAEPGLTLEAAVPAWTPGTAFEPRWSKDRAEDHRARWRAAVEATIARDPQEDAP